ncbi:MAG: alkaline phosphatase [Bacteroidetes bacterium MedPE-SWsnd-G2]|nr:MAG: alkaline phosphatase [Bacteroidetes bacterium MedPE-SWsnd-G2]
MKKVLFVFFCLLTIYSCKNDSKDAAASIRQETNVNSKPKLVVGIVVDQMRYDYLTRFYNRYGEGGFRRLMNEGFNCKNNHFNYVPTYTGPGHASVYTGTTPKYHGIIGNNWYDKVIGKMVYCAGDDSVTPVGTTDNAGKMSPHRMKTTSFADENRLFTQLRGKTIGISLKDRGAILPAGHSANAAYWFHGKDEGAWISSSFYMDELPNWVSTFNASDKAQSYLKEWSTIEPIEGYVESGADLNNFEGGFKGKSTAEFPYDLKILSEENDGFDIIKATPFGNSITADFAIEAIKAEQLGKDNDTDVLTVSFSSTDYVGHNFGVNSKEIQDTYMRLDKDIKRLLDALDAEVGKGNYSVFLTADHGAVDVPAYLSSHNIPAGYINNREGKSKLTAFLKSRYNSEDLVENVSNNQIFLNYNELKRLKLDAEAVQKTILEEVIGYPNVDKAYTAKTMASVNFDVGIEELIQNGFNQKRSGDIIVNYDPAFISYGKTGSTHGSGLNYDTHVPLLFYGNGFVKGSTLEKTVIPDIAPTMSALLGVSFPNGATGQPLDFVLK